MYINISLSKKVLKKIIKYLIFFILACFCIYYSSILKVSATTSSTSSELDITFPLSLTVYDNTTDFPGLNFTSSYGFIDDYTDAYINSSNIGMNTSGVILTLPISLTPGHTYMLYNYWATDESYMIDFSVSSSKVLNTTGPANGIGSEIILNRAMRYPASNHITTIATSSNTYVDLSYVSMSFVDFTYTGTSTSQRQLFVSQMSSSATTFAPFTLAYLGYNLIDVTTLSQTQQEQLDRIEASIASLSLAEVNSKLNEIQEEQQNTSDAIDEQTQQDQKQHEEIMDSNTSGATEDANSFFGNFESSDHGGISGIVSAPLELIKSLINNNNVCSNLNFSIFGKDVHFPSGCILWDKVPDSFITIWNVLICGLGSYGILIALFKDIEKLKTPESKGVDTLDL